MFPLVFTIVRFFNILYLFVLFLDHVLHVLYFLHLA